MIRKQRLHTLPGRLLITRYIKSDRRMPVVDRRMRTHRTTRLISNNKRLIVMPKRCRIARRYVGNKRPWNKRESDPDQRPRQGTQPCFTRFRFSTHSRPPRAINLQKRSRSKKSLRSSEISFGERSDCRRTLRRDGKRFVV